MIISLGWPPLWPKLGPQEGSPYHDEFLLSLLQCKHMGLKIFMILLKLKQVSVIHFFLKRV